MVYTTLVHYHKICPQWDTKVIISVKYRYTRNDDNPYEACYMGSACSILENLRKPSSKREREYAYYPFCRMSDKCEVLHGTFPKIIDTREPFKDGQ